MDQTILNINEEHAVDNYPYNGKKTRAYFSIEFTAKKGFRSVKQTVDPKRNRLNKPHRSTYCPFLCQFRNEDNGHIEEMKMRFHWIEDINPVCAFIAQHFEALQLQDDMMKHVYGTIIQILVNNVRFKIEDGDKRWMLLKPTIQLLGQACQTGDNIFPQIHIDMDHLNQLKEEYEEMSE